MGPKGRPKSVLEISNIKTDLKSGLPHLLPAKFKRNTLYVFIFPKYGRGVKNLFFAGQFASLNDCVNRVRVVDNAKYTIVADIDEFLFTFNSTLLDFIRKHAAQKIYRYVLEMLLSLLVPAMQQKLEVRDLNS